MILACSHVSKAFVEKTVLSDISFHIEEKEKAAIVGVNGAGKSTLLRILIREMQPDSGEVILAKGKTIGYLAQHQDFSGDASIYDTLLQAKQEILTLELQLRKLEQDMKKTCGEELERLLEAYARADHAFEVQGGYQYRSEVIGILKGLGFSTEDFTKSISTLSGGQKTRVSLGKLLLTKPDVLLLDEPTNHLDLNSIAWLEGYLQNYSGSILIVSHDRYFLDRVVTKIIDLDNTHGMVYLCNYTEYAKRKKEMLEVKRKQYLNQQREIKHQEEVIEKLRSFNREKSIRRAESREKLLAKIEVLEKPETDDAVMSFRLDPPVVSGNDVLTVKGLSKSFGSQTLFTDLDFQIKRGERVAIIGDNGTGKTTILKIINELLPADTGIIELGSRVEIAYYDQEHHVLHMEKTLFEEMSDTYPNMTNTQIRNILAAFLFTGDDVYKRISELSGGERGRVSLAKLMLAHANLLILDEPTNHLDIMSKEILEQALCNYTGTVLYVSHDRYFINQTATRILELTEQTLVNYIGNYDYYLEKKEVLSAAALADRQRAQAGGHSKTDVTPNASAQDITTAAADTKLDWKTQKEQQARERKRQNDFAKCEQRIMELEARNEEIDQLLTEEAVFTNVARLLELNKEKSAIEEELETLYIRWEELSE